MFYVPLKLISYAYQGTTIHILGSTLEVKVLRSVCVYTIFAKSLKSPYSLSHQFDLPCFLRFVLFFVVVLLDFASKEASFLRDLDS